MIDSASYTPSTSPCLQQGQAREEGFACMVPATWPGLHCSLMCWQKAQQFVSILAAGCTVPGTLPAADCPTCLRQDRHLSTRRHVTLFTMPAAGPLCYLCPVICALREKFWLLAAWYLPLCQVRRCQIGSHLAAACDYQQAVTSSSLQCLR